MADEIDIFISYAHKDNVPFIKGEKGWVSTFHRALEVRLGQLMTNPKIWRDRKLQGIDQLTEEITDNLHQAKILLAVITPGYLNSEWCMKELNGFIEAAQNKGGVRVGNKSRIFKIIKTFVHYTDHPEKIRDFLGYNFFELDQLDEIDRPQEYMLEKGSPYYYEFQEKLNEVAYDICDLIKAMNESAPGKS